MAKKYFVLNLGARPKATPPLVLKGQDPWAATVDTDESLNAANGIDPDTNEGVIEGGAKGCADGDDTDDSDTDQEDDNDQ